LLIIFCSILQKTVLARQYTVSTNQKTATLEREVRQIHEQYADRDLTLEYLSQAAEVGSDYREEELSQVETSISTCEQDFQTHLNLLKTGQISDAQFAVVNDPIKGNYDGLLQRKSLSFKQLWDCRKAKNGISPCKPLTPGVMWLIYCSSLVMNSS